MMNFQGKKVFISALALMLCCVGISGVKAEERNGKVLTIYKNGDHLSDVSENGTEIGKVTCSTNDCKIVTEILDDNATRFASAIFSNGYVAVEENKQYVIYNYTNDTVAYGPYGKVTEKPFSKEMEGSPLFYYSDWDYGITNASKLYAIGIEEQNDYGVYSFLTGKKISNIKGDVRFVMEGSSVMFDVNDFITKNMIVTWNNATATFTSLETGEKLYSIDGLNEVVKKEEKIYLRALASEGTSELYDMDGNLLFGNIKTGYSYNVLANAKERWIVVVKGGEQFKVYANSKEIRTSKKYTKVLGVTEYNGRLFSLVLDDKNLNLIDEEEKVITTLAKNKENVTGINGAILTVENGVFQANIRINDKEEYINYDMKTNSFDEGEVTERKTCPNDSKIDITACIQSGKTEEVCIKINCPGAWEVENPKTGIYVTTVFILSCITGVIILALKKKNYLKRR